MSASNRSDSVRYDCARGVLLLRKSDGTGWTEFIDAMTLIDSIVAGAVQESLLPAVAGYALALVAHQHSSWPTESRRAALIQVAEQLRSARPSLEALNQMLDNVIARANDSLLRGDANVEAVLVDFVEGRAML